MKTKFISGFSKISKEGKLKLISSLLDDGQGFLSDLKAFNHPKPENQAIIEQFSENTLGNYPLPFSVAPNFLINNRFYTIPMVTEESSVVAAVSAGAGFWADKGGFHAKVMDTIKIGQIHFCWKLRKEILILSQEELKLFLLDNTVHLTQNMVNRGGGILDIELIDFTDQLENYFQLRVKFGTVDSMGANFINTVLEEMALLLQKFYHNVEPVDDTGPVDIVMSILSNYTPECIVECFVETDLQSLKTASNKMTVDEFSEKFKYAMDIASIDTFRAVTHNKGIFNGIDAVLLATANDTRAVAAAGHAYAAITGRYKSLSNVEISKSGFRMNLVIPMPVGTVGGVTNIHPIAKWSFELLGRPNAQELMMIIASAGLSANFSAIRSLITSGIQKGHMQKHLGNILSSLGTDKNTRALAEEYFKGRDVSYYKVKKFLNELKKNQ